MGMDNNIYMNDESTTRDWPFSTLYSTQHLHNTVHNT